ncbi:MAG: NAD(P)/FAD-dependent oxidoreductase [Gemmatirosa sp.]
MTRSAQVIVVGGGPAGASTAWQLAMLGIDVLVLDRARFPRDKACAECVSPQAARILDAMGALADVEAVAARHAGMLVRAPSGDVIHGEYVAAHGHRAYRDRGFGVRRRLLDAILLDRARVAGARVREGARVVDVLRAHGTRGGATGVRVLDAEGATHDLHAALVVGADGLRSLVARRMDVVGRLPWPRRLAFQSHFRGIAGVGALGEMHVERDGFVGIADVGDGVANVAMVAPARVARRGLAEHGTPAAFMDAWLRRAPQLAPRFASAQRVSTVRATGPFASHARTAHAPGVALVGDAADFFDPFTGEGIYSALRGGELLASFAAEAACADASRAARALAQYDVERRREFRGKWTVERLIGLAVAHPPLIDRAARTLSRRRDLADLLVGVAGDFVPPAAVLNARYLWQLFGVRGSRVARAADPSADASPS